MRDALRIDPFLRALVARLAAEEARTNEAEKACNICGYPWPTHYEHCAYVANVRDLGAAEAALRGMLDETLRNTPGVNPDGTVSSSSMAETLARQALAGVSA